MTTTYSKYDGILVGIGITITFMLTGIILGPIMTLGAGVVGAILVGVALFGIPPTDAKPKDLTGCGSYVDTQSDEENHFINT